MERSGMSETTLAIAWIKDAVDLIESQLDESVATWTTAITTNVREYPFPANLIKLKSVAVLDTNDDNKYKKIKRLSSDYIVRKDGNP